MKKVENFFENTVLGQILFVVAAMGMSYVLICLASVLK